MNSEDKYIKSGGKRLFEVDSAKFFALIFMVCIHTFEMYVKWDYHENIPDSLYRNVMEILGGPFAAPVFMFCMGIGMIYTRHDSSAEFIKRGCKLMITGYILNFFRQTLPMLIAMMMDIETGYDLMGGLLNVDILQFAGMAFITIGLMKKLKMSHMQMCGVAVVLQAAGIWGTYLKIKSVTVQTLLGLLLPCGEHVAFPMTLWLMYPVLGMILGEQLKKTDDKEWLYKKLMVCAALFFLAYTVTLLYIGYDIRTFYSLADSSYYFQNILFTLWMTPLIILMIGMCFFILRNMEQTLFGRFIRYCSVNLKTIYITQWILIGYSYAFSILLRIDKTDSLGWLIFVGFVILGVAIAISFLYNKIRKCIRKKNKE